MRLLLLLFSFATSQAAFYNVDSNLGKLNGLISYAMDGSTVLTFKGIPYAKAPIGPLRFKHSEPYGSWNETLNATKFSPACVQREGWGMGFIENETVSEDCLFLNIYVPGSNIDVDYRKAVMVYIHGGGFVEGAANFYHSENLASTGDVIVVTINYRLGMFGFMTTGDDTIPGNMGIGDQILALKWVQENIADYGGDKNKVTIFGESAGGMSVSVLASSQMAAGLFNRVIGQSGTIMYAEHRSTASAMGPLAAERLGCSGFSLPHEVYQCLHYADADVIHSALNMYEFNSKVYIDDYILQMQPKDIWQAGLQNDVDYMTGVTSADGTIILDIFDPSKQYLQNGLDETTSQMIIAYVTDSFEYDFNCSEAAEIITDYYFSGEFYDNGRNLEGAINLLTDVTFLTPAVQLSHLALRNDQNVYWYYFDQPEKKGTPEGDAIIDIGAAHASELSYVFGFILGNGNEKDQLLTYSMMTAWTSFAKTGMPVWIDKYGSQQMWPEYTWNTAEFVVFNDELDPVKNIEEWTIEARAKFWLENIAMCEPFHSTDGATKFGSNPVIILTIAAIIYWFKA